jgi:hypothetical protein
MAGDSGFAVQAHALIKHAGTVDEVISQVEQAHSAAATVRMGREAYGILCQLIPAMLDPIQDLTIAALREAADALQRSADALRATARDYTGSDVRTGDVLRGGCS